MSALPSGPIKTKTRVNCILFSPCKYAVCALKKYITTLVAKHIMSSFSTSSALAATSAAELHPLYGTMRTGVDVGEKKVPPRLTGRKIL